MKTGLEQAVEAGMARTGARRSLVETQVQGLANKISGGYTDEQIIEDMRALYGRDNPVVEPTLLAELLGLLR